MDDKFLTPLNKIEKAIPSSSLYQKIEDAFYDNKFIPMQTITLVAACILLLFFVNIYAVNTTSIKDSLESTATYAEQIINNFEIY